MVKTKNSKKKKYNRSKNTANEPDSVYVLKLVLYLIIGSQWIRITNGDMLIPIPIGLIIGIFFARMEHFKIERKIEYAMLLLSMFIGFWLPLGLEIALG